MTEAENEMLKQEFNKDQNWNKEQVTEVAARLQIARLRVYKWGWDRKKRSTIENQP